MPIFTAGERVRVVGEVLADPERDVLRYEGLAGIVTWQTERCVMVFWPARCLSSVWLATDLVRV